MFKIACTVDNWSILLGYSPLSLCPPSRIYFHISSFREEHCCILFVNRLYEYLLFICEAR